jgi:hypothetical protein
MAEDIVIRSEGIGTTCVGGSAQFLGTKLIHDYD